MQMRDYLTRYNSLASEDAFYNIPYRKEFLLSRVGRGKRVLDVGCLGGKVSRLIMDQNNEVWGVEVNPTAASVAEKRGIRVKIANVEDGIPFEAGAFDIVSAGEVVESLYDTKYFFLECHRVLKDNGLLIFSTPNLNSLKNRIRVAMGGYPEMVGAYPEDHFGEHVRVLNLKKIRELCRQTGFVLEDIAGIPSLEAHGRLVDTSLEWVGRLLPSFSKMLMISARRV